jgi:hypothetical protein
MSASTVIGDVTQTLKDLLTSEQRPAQLFTVSHGSPAEETTPESAAKPVINLFLFRVAENPHAKNQEWEPVGDDRLRYPPLALNLFYLLTPFAKDKIDEHRVLGEAMRVFHENSVIEAPLLKGVLADTSEELKLDLLQTSFEDLARVWTALTKPYRLSVCYEARIALVDSLFEREGRRVIEKELRFVKSR